MTPGRWQQVRRVLEAAFSAPSRVQPGLLDVPDRGNQPLRNDVEDLLAQATCSDPLLDSPLFPCGLPDVNRASAISTTELDEHPLPFLEIGPYRLEAPLGHGGMGEVFKAYDTRLGRHVAIKVLGERLSSNPAHARLLLREARAVARLNHPNIAAVYDVLESQSRSVIVMEYLEGETLAQRLARGALPVAEVCRLGSAIAQGLAHAHGHEVLHCDMKPANVFLARGGQVKLLDFGLARLAGRGKEAPSEGIGASPTLVDRRAGTPAYMAPEQWLGRPLDPRTDVFSLGILIHEMATGRRPAPPASDETTGPDNAAARIDPAVPHALRPVIAKAIALDSRQRYQSADAVERALRRIQAGGLGRYKVLMATGAPLSLIVAASIGITHQPGTFAQPSAKTGAAGSAVVRVWFPQGAQQDTGLASGLADLLAGELAREPNLTVLLPTPGEAAAVGDANDQAFLVKGSIQPAGPLVAVTAMLVEGATGRVLWSESVETPRESAFAVVRPIRDGVVRVFRTRGVPAVVSSLTASRQLPTRDAEAFRAYGEAISFLERADVPGNTTRAIMLFDTALARDPGFVAAQAGLARAHWLQYELTNDAEALAAARRAVTDALRLDATTPGVRATLALIESASGRNDVAIEELRREIGSYPNADLPHRLLGRLLAESGRMDEAEREFKTALSIRPLFWENYRALGLAYFDADRLDEAAAAFERITQLQPDNAWGYQQLATVRHAQGHLDVALDGYERANRISPSPAAWSNIGSIHYARHEYHAAAEAYLKAIHLFPQNAVTHRNLGDAYGKLGDRRRSREAYLRAVLLADEVLSVNPKHARMLALSALCLAKVGVPARPGAAAPRPWPWRPGRSTRGTSAPQCWPSPGGRTRRSPPCSRRSASAPHATSFTRTKTWNPCSDGRRSGDRLDLPARRTSHLRTPERRHPHACATAHLDIARPGSRRDGDRKLRTT